MARSTFRAVSASLLVLLFSTIGVSAQSGRVRKPRPTAPAEQKQIPQPERDPDPVTPQRKDPVAVTADISARYAGGSLGIEQGAKLNVSFKGLDITFVSKKVTYKVATNEIMDISYGQSVRTRTAEGVGVGVLIPTAGDIISRSKKVDHYIEIIWNGNPDGGIVLKVDKDDYRGLIAALEASTGLQVRREPELYPDFP